MELFEALIITPIGGPGPWAALTLDDEESIETQINKCLNTVSQPEI